jgi:hypothetical protein
MDSIIINPQNKTELNLLKGLLKKMDIPATIVHKKAKKENNTKKRPYALSKGKFTMDESFNDPLPDELLDTFYK